MGCRFEAPVTASALLLAGAPSTPRDGDIVAAYSRLMEHPDVAVREKAATEWCAWEDAVLSGETNGTPNVYGDRPQSAQLGFVRICSHCFSHGAWLEEGVLMREAGRLADIPGVLIHGRLDMGGPTAPHCVGTQPHLA